MFNNSSSTTTKHIPGYTGHVSQQRFDPQPPVEQPLEPVQYQIPGYLGFIPSIKSDNMYGKSYGRTTNLVSNGNIEDFDMTKPWTTTAKLQFVDQQQVKLLSAAEVVGLEDKYQQTIKSDNVQNTNELPLPGYTGVSRRIVASNLFGQTYANSLKTAQNDLQELDQERYENYNQQTLQIPDIRK